MKKKLNLKELKVQSFITSTESENIKGGMKVDSVVCLTGNYPTLPVNNCVSGDMGNCQPGATTDCFTGTWSTQIVCP